jgi:ATP-dependent RNA helicase DDX21
VETTVSEEKHIDEAAVINSYRVSPETIAKLHSKGIKAFFPIQYETYDLIYDGYDLVGRGN